MSLIVLGVASRAHVRSLRLAGEGDRLEPTWLKVQEFFFSGADDDDMEGILETVDEHVRHRTTTGSMKKVLAFTLDRLKREDVVILGFSNVDNRSGHWVLAVGVEIMAVGNSRTTTGLLCLDSAEEPPIVAPTNTRLELESPGRGARYLHYRLPNGDVRNVTCKTAISLTRRR